MRNPVIRLVSPWKLLIVILIWLSPVILAIILRAGDVVMVVCFAISFVLIIGTMIFRLWFSREFRAGMKKYRRSDFAGAVPHFAAASAWLRDRPTLDGFASFISASSVSFSQLAKLNLAACYSHSGQIDAAIPILEELEQKNPKFALARLHLNLLRNVRQSSRSET